MLVLLVLVTIVPLKLPKLYVIVWVNELLALFIAIVVSLSISTDVALIELFLGILVNATVPLTEPPLKLDEVELKLVSCDYINFEPYLIEK